jgi:hypothetical protein
MSRIYIPFIIHIFAMEKMITRVLSVLLGFCLVMLLFI